MVSFLLAVVIFSSVCALEKNVIWHPNQCWSYDSIGPNNTKISIGTTCPLFGLNDSLPTAHCVLILTAPESQEREEQDENYVNKACGHCAWKQKEKGICQNTQFKHRRECCCRKTHCNKVLYIDAQPGWMNYIQGRNEPKADCMQANFSLNRDPEWMIHGFRKCKYQRTCYLRAFEDANHTMVSLEMGCLDPQDADFRGECDRHDLCTKTMHKHLCCCIGQFCNSRVYRESFFDKIMDIRYKDELNYISQMNEAKNRIPETLRTGDSNYHASKMYVDIGLVLFTTIYLLCLYIAFRVYKPVEMHKRQPDPSNEAT